MGDGKGIHCPKLKDMPQGSETDVHLWHWFPPCFKICCCDINRQMNCGLGGEVMGACFGPWEGSVSVASQPFQTSGALVHLEGTLGKKILFASLIVQVTYNQCINIFIYSTVSQPWRRNGTCSLREIDVNKGLNVHERELFGIEYWCWRAVWMVKDSFNKICWASTMC